MRLKFTFITFPGSFMERNADFLVPQPRSPMAPGLHFAALGPDSIQEFISPLLLIPWAALPFPLGWIWKAWAGDVELGRGKGRASPGRVTEAFLLLPQQPLQQEKGQERQSRQISPC